MNPASPCFARISSGWSWPVRCTLHAASHAALLHGWQEWNRMLLRPNCILVAFPTVASLLISTPIWQHSTNFSKSDRHRGYFRASEPGVPQSGAPFTSLVWSGPCPEAVAREFERMGASAGRFTGLKLPSFCQITPVTDVPAKLIAEARLDIGEAETLALAIKVPAATILLDESAARAVAQELGILIGTLGLLLRAKQRGLVTEIAPLLRRLIVEGRFRVSPALVNATLQRAGELP
jgi:uncharacterized protein